MSEIDKKVLVVEVCYTRYFHGQLQKQRQNRRTYRQKQKFEEKLEYEKVRNCSQKNS